MMKRLFAFAATKLADAVKTTDDTDDDSQLEPRTDGGDATLVEGAATDAADLLYADDDAFEAAFADEWPSLPGESLTWLVESGDSEMLLIGYDRSSPSDDEYLQTPAIGCDDAPESVDE